jgi:hypothetical protein
MVELSEFVKVVLMVYMTDKSLVGLSDPHTVVQLVYCLEQQKVDK